MPLKWWKSCFSCTPPSLSLIKYDNKPPHIYQIIWLIHTWHVLSTTMGKTHCTCRKKRFHYYGCKYCCSVMIVALAIVDGWMDVCFDIPCLLLWPLRAICTVLSRSLFHTHLYICRYIRGQVCVYCLDQGQFDMRTGGNGGASVPHIHKNTQQW